MTAAALLLALSGPLCSSGDAPSQPEPGLRKSPEAPVIVSVMTPDDRLRQTFEKGQTWDVFLGTVPANARKLLWDRNWATGTVPAELLARARATGGPWKILAITDPACSDSVNTVPYLAHLASVLAEVEMRVVNAIVGRPWMEAHRSPDGRASTPTVLLLDDEFRIRGCWIEQPVGLQGFWLDVVARGTQTREVGRKLAWYEEDAGVSTLREFVEVMEAANSGSPLCPGLS
jgi:hypothetical protein